MDEGTDCVRGTHGREAPLCTSGTDGAATGRLQRGLSLPRQGGKVEPGERVEMKN